MNTNYDFILNIIGIRGIEIISTDVNNGIFEIFVASTKDFAMCPRCGHITQKRHDSRYQPIKHLPIWGMDTIIIFNKRRYVCDCDPKHPFDESINFVSRYQRQTIGYEKHVTTVTHKNTVKNGAEICGISEGRCQRIYNFYANKVLKSREMEFVRILGIDDIARRKGHNYNIVVYNQETGNVVDIITGRTKEDVITYLSNGSEDARFNIEAVSIDMSRSYCSSVLECFPNAKPVIDRFHIAQNLYKNVADARKHIQNHIKKHGKKDGVFKIRWAFSSMLRA